MASHPDRTPVASTQHLPCRSDGDSLDNAISDDNGDYLQRRFHALPRRDYQPPFITLLPKWQLTQAEMLTIYLMVTLACVVCGHDLLQATMCVLGHATWFATPENEWQSLFFRYIPDWIAVMNRGALTGYYEGTSIYLKWSISVRGLRP